MDEVFIIGVPKAIRHRLEAEARRNGIRVSSVLVDVGKRGKLMLLPHPSQTVSDLRAYIDRLKEIQDARIVVLPYAPVPFDVKEELAVIEGCGGSLLTVVEGDNGWCTLERRRPDTGFLNTLYGRLVEELFQQDQGIPSDYFQTISRVHASFILPDGVLNVCDHVSQHRYAFLRKAADSFAELIGRNGDVGPLDNFFRSHGLEHAQTGGISATLTVHKNGTRIHSKTTSVHLKQGDNTTPQAAARVYYQTLTLEQQYHIILLYAGPHPDTDVTRRWDMD